MDPVTGTIDARSLADRRSEASRLARRDLAISNGRLAAVVAAAILGWLAWGEGAVTAWSLLAPAAAFAGLVVVHHRVIDRKLRLERAAAFYERGLARLDHLWMGKGTS